MPTENYRYNPIDCQEAARRISRFLDEQRFNEKDRAEILADPRILQGLDTFGILVSQLKNDLNGVEDGLDRWWATEVT